MAVATITKQPYEALNWAHDFSPDCQSGVTLTLVSVTATNLLTGANSTSAVIAANPAPAVSGQEVLFQVQDGADGDQHKIDIRVSTSAGELLEADLLMFVKQQ
jgi:hypothetical protein